MMKVTIGILAHNEATHIEGMLRSLFEQSVFRPVGPTTVTPPLCSRIDIVVIPNGCEDATASLSRACLAMASVASPPSSSAALGVEFNSQVVVLDQADKCGAWNHLIHHVSPRDTDVFVVADADIVFDHPDTIRNCLQLLIDRPHLSAVVDQPQKSFSAKARLTPLQRFSLRMSQAQRHDPPGLCGQFYCARASVLRTIWLPQGLCGDDGFLNAMLTTNCFRAPADRGAIARAPSASHFFEGLTRLSDIVHHEVRLVIGTTQNDILAEAILPLLTDPNSQGAGALIHTLNTQRAQWCELLIQRTIAARGWMRIPKFLWYRRFIPLRTLPLSHWITALPRQLVATVFDWCVFIIANHKLKSHPSLRFW